ncbi:sigma-54-dependent transcriptional regulator [Insolitispirillum peregrinum]|uniref:sigma-54-dependent transcriptional regulator n=1 Tax=Insolitispirillum peregrinum TaxID=80876 RepID=UPI00158CC199|nr:sigma 54-interacting transcriptional regulator [Insolitispirillum peregrinum]
MKTLRQELTPHCPKIHRRPWKTSATPTDHDEIRKFAERVLTFVRQSHPNDVMVIHLSPGTPAMHAVWLALGSTGFASGPVKLIQTSDQRALSSGKPPLQVVDFRLDTVLRRYAAARPYVTEDADSGQVWDLTQIQSQALKSTLEKLRKWAPLRVPVLLLGERGSGKTTLANYLRAESPFQKLKGESWPSVVCGQFRTTPQLARSELFGHVKGAFSGAEKQRTGLLEKADGDTVFFDEIADIDHDTQRLLIAALEGRGFYPLGGEQLVRSKFRVICATNRTLEELTTTLLDRDFFDRINSVVIQVPALRDCTADIPLAWRAVLSQATQIASIQPREWERFRDHPEVLRHLMGHRLPGNFRDLQRVALHLLAELNYGSSDAEAIGNALSCLDVDSGGVGSENIFTPSLPADFPSVLAQFERKWLEAAMKEANGNVSKAARLLGMKRENFNNRIKKYNTL